MKLSIVGNGVFGNFMKGELSKLNKVQIIEPHMDADFILMCVPFESFESVASQFKNKHLINVCSVQEESNKICLMHSKNVTGIHPMFGPRSPIDGRTSIVTLKTKDSEIVIELFKNISEIVTTANGKLIDGAFHDFMMSKTHKKVVEISDMILKLATDASDIPDNCLPTSFKRLRLMAEQFLDMPKGTKSSILANKR